MTLRLPNWALTLCLVGVAGAAVLMPSAGFILATAMTGATWRIRRWRLSFGILAVLLLVWVIAGTATGVSLSTGSGS